MEIYTLFGYWSWAIIGLILLILELFIAGAYLMWFGLAAFFTAITIWFLQHFMPFSHWQLHGVLFILYSAIALFIAVRYFHRAAQSDQPLLNHRTEQMLGQIATLNEDIKDGRGHARIGDTLWRVSGPNLPRGSNVRLLKFQNGAFLVEKVEE